MSVTFDTAGLDASACSQALEKIKQVCEEQKQYWFGKCKDHDNAETKQNWITCDMLTFETQAKDLHDKGDPVPMLDLLDKVRAYDPR